MPLEPAAVPEEEIGESYGRLLEWVVSKYGEHIGKKDLIAYVDHTPSNIRYVNILLTIFPGGSVIHIVRGGRAVTASIEPLV